MTLVYHIEAFGISIDRVHDFGRNCFFIIRVRS